MKTATWRAVAFLGVMLAMGAAVSGCYEPNCPECLPPVRPSYKPPTSAENAMNNLVVSYKRREIGQYARLLHPEFVFRFQDGDAPPELGRGFWTRDEDSTATAALFRSPQVADIILDLTYRDAEPATESGLEHAMKIRVSPMKLAVYRVNGAIYLAEGDIQDMFFVRGDGADSTNWYLIEWRDLADHEALDETSTGGAVRTSWGKLKQKF